MSIATELTALQQDITNARTAITTKGGTVTSGGGSSQLATDIATIPSGSGITDRMANTLYMIGTRSNNPNCVETFDYDEEDYSVLDLSIYDNYANGSFRIKSIGQRMLNSFDSGTSQKIRVRMPQYLEEIRGSNWHGTLYVKYYDFSAYKRNVVPAYTSTTTSLGNSSARVLVPLALETAWKSATGWSNFATQIIGVSEVYD